MLLLSRCGFHLLPNIVRTDRGLSACRMGYLARRRTLTRCRRGSSLHILTLFVCRSPESDPAPFTIVALSVLFRTCRINRRGSFSRGLLPFRFLLGLRILSYYTLLYHMNKLRRPSGTLRTTTPTLLIQTLLSTLPSTLGMGFIPSVDRTIRLNNVCRNRPSVFIRRRVRTAASTPPCRVRRIPWIKRFRCLSLLLRYLSQLRLRRSIDLFLLDRKLFRTRLLLHFWPTSPTSLAHFRSLRFLFRIGCLPLLTSRITTLFGRQCKDPFDQILFTQLGLDTQTSTYLAQFYEIFLA